MKLSRLFQSDTRPPGDPFAKQEPDACCGRHLFCEKELWPNTAAHPVEYYDDDELDTLAGRSSASYNEEEIERFGEVVSTMLATDVAGWLHSLRLRGIELPDSLKEEVLLLLSD
jgi:hypothetical protein